MSLLKNGYSLGVPLAVRADRVVWRAVVAATAAAFDDNFKPRSRRRRIAVKKRQPVGAASLTASADPS